MNEVQIALSVIGSALTIAFVIATIVITSRQPPNTKPVFSQIEEARIQELARDELRSRKGFPSKMWVVYGTCFLPGPDYLVAVCTTKEAADSAARHYQRTMRQTYPDYSFSSLTRVGVEQVNGITISAKQRMYGQGHNFDFRA